MYRKGFLGGKDLGLPVNDKSSLDSGVGHVIKRLMEYRLYSVQIKGNNHPCSQNIWSFTLVLGGQELK